MSESDISDEDAILPAIGVLDDLDSDISFSDEDDPALQDLDDTQLKSNSVSTNAGALKPSNYAVKDPFWTGQKHASEQAALEERKIKPAAKQGNARDAAIIAGKFIPCPNYTIERQGFVFQRGDFGPGYYGLHPGSDNSEKPSSWPKKFQHHGLKIGLYSFSR